MKSFLLLMCATFLVSCANLYKERAYVTELSSSSSLKGNCGTSTSQNRIEIKSPKGLVSFQTPIHYDYWWTGPLVLPLFPIAKERADPSFVKITLEADMDVLNRDELMTSEIFIKSDKDTIKPQTIVYTTDEKREKFIIQFDSPKLVDAKRFRLKLPDSLIKESLILNLATETHYVPLLPVMIGNCVTN